MKTPDTPRKPVRPAPSVEALERRIAPATAKKDPNPPPYPPGTKYGLARRDLLDSHGDKKPARDETKPTPVPDVESLERRIAPSTIDKKNPTPPPYAPGTDYGLVRRDHLDW